MGNETFRINGERGIVGAGQFCSSLLQNWDLNTHLPCSTLSSQKLKPTRVLL
jgi:hypothetical protein